MNEAQPKAYADSVPVFCAHDAIEDVNKLTPNPKNPNTHPDSQIQLLGRIIRSAGWRQPITVSTRSGFIVKGHGRLAAALLEGMKEVPVDYQSYESEAAEYADMVADNRLAELAELDQKMLAEVFAEIDMSEIPMELTGYTDKEAQKIIDALSDALDDISEEADEVPEAPEPDAVVTQPGDIWILGRHRLMCGDSTDRETVDSLMDGIKADMVFTDPPYNVAIGDKNKALDTFSKAGRITENIAGDAGMTDEECGRTLWLPAFENMRNSAKDCCAIYVTMPQGGTHMMMMMMMAQAGWQVKHELVWVKNAPTFSMGRLDYDYMHEPICFGWNKTHKKIGKGTYTKSVWTIDKPRACNLHPTMKPVELIVNALENSSENGDTVLDLFGGSGSTMIACEEAGRICRMMELDPKYCDVIVRRYIRTTDDTAGVRLIRNGEEMDREIFESMLEE